jgi:hypothetical protein
MKEKVNDELGRMWNGALLVCFEIFPGIVMGEVGKSDAAYLTIVSRLFVSRIEFQLVRVRIRSAKHKIATWVTS